jgi:hypothetical protein
MHTFIQIIDFFIQKQNITNGFNPLYCYNNGLKEEIKKGIKEEIKEGINEIIKEGIIKEGINEIIKEGINEIINEKMIKCINRDIITNYKFKILYKNLNVMFITEEQKEYLMDMFCKIQKIYKAFSLLAFIYKFKKAKVVITTDLNLNEIIPKKNNVIILYQNNLKYYFTLRDLINIIKTNLTNSDILFLSNPSIIKNPYINVPFTETNLYNIYFEIKSSNYIMPELFQGYFIYNFNLKQFNFQFENSIRNQSIKNFVYNSHVDILHPHVFEMIYICAPKKLFTNIHAEFPKNKLVDIMKPYLHLYMLDKYSMVDTYIYLTSQYILRKQLALFVAFNPLFGRKYIKTKNIFGKIIKEITFNDKCINFYTNNIL